MGLHAVNTSQLSTCIPLSVPFPITSLHYSIHSYEETLQPKEYMQTARAHAAPCESDSSPYLGSWSAPLGLPAASPFHLFSCMVLTRIPTPASTDATHMSKTISHSSKGQHPGPPQLQVHPQLTQALSAYSVPLYSVCAYNWPLPLHKHLQLVLTAKCMYITCSSRHCQLPCSQSLNLEVHTCINTDSQTFLFPICFLRNQFVFFKETIWSTHRIPSPLPFSLLS